MLRVVALLILLIGATVSSLGQARATASRVGEAQVGFSFLNGNSDYARSRFNGYGIYADFDFHHGFGAEAEFRYISDGDPYPQTNVYERTYQVGGRYSRHYGRYQPFAKLLVGRGVFNYPYNTANIAYNMGTLGAGADIRVIKHVYARADFEYQKWFSFSKDGSANTRNDSLTPIIVSGGVAYRF